MSYNGSCDICGINIEVKVCCDGYECGCLGLPIEPPICHKDECWEKYLNKN